MSIKPSIKPSTLVEEDPTGEYPTIPERRTRVHVTFAGGTHAGHARPRNEDQYLIAKLAKSMRDLRVEFARVGNDPVL